MRFVWFLSFWGWSRESHRAGLLLRHPLEGIGGNWDEWFGGEATAAERAEIEAVGRSEEAQRQFLHWLEEVWSGEAVKNGNRVAVRFVRRELARVAPFDRWPTLAAPRETGEGNELSALVLADGSDGRPEDVRGIEAVLLLVHPPAAGRMVVAEGFQAEATDLQVARAAALGLLRGRAGWALLARWVFTGRRPYPRWLRVTLGAGWLAVGGLVGWLWFGPDPGERLGLVAAVLAGLWSTLVLVAVAGAGVQVWSARRAAAAGAAHLARDQVRLRLAGRFTLKGGSAGLPFALGILQALGRAYPGALDQWWLWRRFFRELETPGTAWAATGVMTAAGTVQPVELTAKLHACLRHDAITDVLTPAQPEPKVTEAPGDARPRPLRLHRCRSLAQAVLAVGRLGSPGQTVMNLVALVVSGVMLCALPDLACIVAPPPAPVVVGPSSPSPYFLWVSLDTDHPEFFEVVLESPVWANRRAEVVWQESQPASVRAEIRLVRLSQSSIRNLEEGVVWIERRPCFLTRRFQPGEIVGRYTLVYLNRLRHD